MILNSTKQFVTRIEPNLMKNKERPRQVCDVADQLVAPVSTNGYHSRKRRHKFKLVCVHNCHRTLAEGITIGIQYNGNKQSHKCILMSVNRLLSESLIINQLMAQPSGGVVQSISQQG